LMAAVRADSVVGFHRRTLAQLCVGRAAQSLRLLVTQRRDLEVGRGRALRRPPVASRVLGSDEPRRLIRMPKKSQGRAAYKLGGC
jgi:hypothetical protein